MILYILVLSLAAVVVNLTLPLIAGLYIVDDLGGSTYMSSYLVSFFCIGNMLGVPLGKPRSTPFNPMHLYLACLICMMFFSLLCALASDFFYLNLFRFFEGVASGPLYLLITTALIPEFVTKKNKNVISSLLVTCFALGPVLAASWGGWIAFYHNWRLLFVSHVLYCLLFLTYFSYHYKDYYKVTETVQFDKLGYFFYALSVICLGSALTRGQELDWFRSNLICFLIGTGGISALFFLLRCVSAEHPIIQIRLLKNIYFSLAMLHVSLLFATYFGMIILLSLWLRLYVNYSAAWVLLSISITLFGAWIPILINYKSYDPRIPLAIALLFLIVSSFFTSTFNVEIDFGRIAISRIMAGIGLSLFLAPLFRLAVQTFPKDMIAECLNFFHIIRLWGSGIGVAFYVILWQRRQVFYYERLSSRLTDFSTLTQKFLMQAHLVNLKGKQAAAQLSYYLNRQATALALDDCFYLMSWLMFLLLLLLFILSLFREPILLDNVNESTQLNNP